MDWSEFLEAWEGDVRSLLRLMPEGRYSSSELERLLLRHLRRDPADRRQLEIAADRLVRVEIPEDLQSFYLTTNGWFQFSFDAWDLEVQPVDNWRLLSSCNSDYVDSVLEYFRNVEADDPEYFSRRSFDRILILSDCCQDGCYIADPLKNGSWKYAVVRFQGNQKIFKSFEDLMRSEREECLYNLRGLL